MVKTITSSKTIVKLSKTNSCLCLMINNQLSTNVPQKKHSGLINEMFWTQWLCEWRRRENRWHIGSARCFCRKTSFKSKLKLMQTWVYPNGVWFTTSICVTNGIQHITERESKNTFELICEQPLICWRGIRVRKLSQ